MTAQPLVGIVDDDPVNVLLSRRQLERLGCRSVVAFDGPAALRLFGEAPQLAMILMDRGLPGMDGEACTRFIRRQERPGQHLPIIAVSASVGREAREACAGAGMDEFLAKPTSLESLSACLTRWLPAGTWVAPGRPDRENAVAEVDATTVRDIRRLYDANFRSRVGLIEAAIHRGDPEAVADAAHSLRGPSLLTQEKAVADICRQIEDRARTGSLRAATDLAGRLLDARA